MDEMLDPEMARLRAMRVADLIDGLVGLDRKPFEWEQYKKVLREKMVAAGAAKLSDLMQTEFERSATVYTAAWWLADSSVGTVDAGNNQNQGRLVRA